MLTVPLRRPTTVGVKVTWMVQLAPPASDEPQLLAWPKSPVAAIPVNVSAAPPVFTSVSIWMALVVPRVWLAKGSAAGLSEIAAGTASPIPVRLSNCGELAALSEKLMVPVRAPGAVGLKVTEMVQLAPAATGEPQVLARAKSPVAAIVDTVSAAVPLLVSVTFTTGLIVPTVWAPKFSAAGLSKTLGPRV